MSATIFSHLTENWETNKTITIDSLLCTGMFQDMFVRDFSHSKSEIHFREKSENLWPLNETPRDKIMIKCMQMHNNCDV